MASTEASAGCMDDMQMRLLDFCGIKPMEQPLSKWFAELEDLYKNMGVIDPSVKAFHVMTILENDISDANLELLDFSLGFAHKPAGGHSPYEALKEQILCAFKYMEPIA